MLLIGKGGLEIVQTGNTSADVPSGAFAGARGAHGGSRALTAGSRQRTCSASTTPGTGWVPRPSGQEDRAVPQVRSLGSLSAPPLPFHRVGSQPTRRVGPRSPGRGPTRRVSKAKQVADSWFIWEVFCRRHLEGGSSNVCAFTHNIHPFQ